MRRFVAGLLAVAATATAACGGGGADRRETAGQDGAATTTTTSAAPVPAATPPTADSQPSAPPAVPAPARTTPSKVPTRPAAVPAPARTTPSNVPTRPAAVPAPATTTTTGALPPVTEPFESSVAVIDDAIAARMTSSWRPGCPVALADLRLVTVSHWGFDGSVRTGEVVVNVRVADPVVGAFERIFRARFPIERMRLVDEYGADDDRSMADNNTSAFNCRTVSGSDRWSEHAYGTAIDINPVQNPYVTRSGVSPPAGAAYTTRTASTPGLITRDGPVVAALGAIGWGWGGSWSSGKDYQHFSASGR